MTRGRPVHSLWALINSDENIKKKFIELADCVSSIEIQRSLRNEGFAGKTYNLSITTISRWKRYFGISNKKRGRPIKIYIPDD